jgi:hypothetical protein
VLLLQQKCKLPRHDLETGCFRAETSLRHRTAAKAVGGQRGVRIACQNDKSGTNRADTA